MRRWFGRKFWLAVLFAAMIASPQLWQLTQPPIIDCGRLNAIGDVTSMDTVPGDLGKLDGKRVIVSGWMIPLDEEPMRVFLLDTPREWLVPHAPRPESQVWTALVPGATTPSEQIQSEQVDVSGTFHVRIYRDDLGRIDSIFQLDAKQVALSGQQDPPMWVPLTRLAGIVGMVGVLIVPISLAIGQNIIAFRRMKVGNCARCGYDLRATPHRCPECGWSSLERLADCPDR